MSEKASLPGGVYVLEDGREFPAMDDFQVAAAARAGWRRQQVQDVALALKLERERKKVDAVHPPGVVQLPLI